MSKKTGFFIVALLLVVAALLLWVTRSVEQSSVAKTPAKKSEAPLSVAPSAPAQAETLAKKNARISLKTQSREDAQREYWERHKKDQKFEWKIPIRFYGKVVDQNSQSVVG